MKKYAFWALLLLCLSCKTKTPQPININSPHVTTFSDIAMTMPYRILVGKTLSDEETEQVKQIIAQKFAEANQIYNNWNPDSEISQLNRMKAGEKRKISPVLETLFSHSQKVVEITNGLFDPTINPLQLLWKASLEKEEEPSAEKIKELTPAIGWKNVHFSNGEFFKDFDETSLDFGGIAKGFLVDQLTEALNQAHYPDLFVEWGGEIRASGKHPEGRSWMVFISRLGDSNQENAIATLQLDDQSIATSGDYHQYWVIKGANSKPVTYFHIIDPRTLKPLVSKTGSIASASVLAKDCWFADGLATAASIFDSADDAEDWAKQIQEKCPDVDFWFITRESDIDVD